MPIKSASPLGRFRWRICAVLFLATTINYIDPNLFSFTMLDETFFAVGSVVGIGGLGGTLLAAKVGFVINTGGYVPLFAIAASAYLLALLVFHLLAPKLATVELRSAA